MGAVIDENVRFSNLNKISHSKTLKTLKFVVNKNVPDA